MKEKEEKQKGNFWLTAATFIVNKRKAIEILFILAIIYSVLSINKVQVNQDITSYLPADSETRQGLSIMDEQFVTPSNTSFCSEELVAIVSNGLIEPSRSSVHHVDELMYNLSGVTSSLLISQRPLYTTGNE